MGNTVLVKNKFGELGDIPADQLDDALKSGYSQVSDQELLDFENQKQYGEGMANEAKAFGLGAASAATFGLSDQALTKTGLVEPETIKQLQEHNPVAYGTGQVAGIVGSALLPVGGAVGIAARGAGAVERAAMAALPEATTLAGRIVQTAAAKGVGSAAEGALYSAGTLISDEALGDPDLNAEKVLSELGYGAVMGGAVGAFLGSASQGMKEFRGRPKTLAQKVSAGNAPVATEGAEEALEQAIPEEALGMPTSFDDVIKRVSDAGEVYPAELPGKAILEKASADLPDMKYLPHQVQLESMNSPQVRDIYKTIRESQTEYGKALQDYEALQKVEARKLLGETAESLSKNLEKDAYKGGEEIAEAFYRANQAEKKAAGQAFEKLKEVAPNLRIERSEMLQTLRNAIPEADSLYRVIEDEASLANQIKMRPYSPKMPVSKSVYAGVRDIFNAAAEDGLSVRDLRNLRDNLGTLVKFDSTPIEKAQIGALRKATMDLIEAKVQEAVPDLQVRDAFRRYAVNEGKREAMERVFGGSFDDKASLLKQIKPENLSDNVFRNSATISVAKEVLEPKVFDRLVGNHIAQKVEQFTTDGVFSSRKFSTWMKNNATELNIAFADKPEVLRRMEALSEIMRILPDAPSINPSGTAKTADLLQRVNIITRFIGQAGQAIRNPLDTLGDALVSTAEAAATKADVKALEEIMAGKSAKEALKKGGMLAAVERQVNQATKRLDSLVSRALGSSDTMAHWVTGSLVNLTHDRKLQEFEKIEKRIDEASATPETYLDAVAKPTEKLYPIAPNISGAMQQSLTRTTQFLKSKLPNTQPSGPFARKPTPSSAELSKFFRYYEVVENPYVVLKQLKFGTLTPESMETMQAVYPKLLGEMQGMIFEKLADKKAKNKPIPYQTQILLSAFLGKDLSGDIQNLPQTQAAWAAPTSKQDGLQGPVNPTQSGMQSITLAGRSETALEKVTSRE